MNQQTDSKRLTWQRLYIPDFVASGKSRGSTEALSETCKLPQHAVGGSLTETWKTPPYEGLRLHLAFSG
jgi:hypothetical protein